MTSRDTRLARAAAVLAALLLLVVEPTGLALWLASVIGRLLDRGPGAVLLVGARVAATAIGIAAGLRLWREPAGGVRLAQLALTSAMVTTLVSTTTRVLPTSRVPGDGLMAAAAAMLYYGALMATISLAARRLRQRE